MRRSQLATSIMRRLSISHRRCIEYANQVAIVLGLEACSAPILLEERSGLDGDVKLVSDCASSPIRIAYWPEGLKRVGDLFGAAPEALVVVGFVECLTFGILQHHWAQSCLNNCGTCRF